MKKNKIVLGLMIATIALYNCNSNENKEMKNEGEEVISTYSTNQEISVENIDKIRTEIESLEITPVELTTAGLREKIKQKWVKIHFYVEKEVVVKIKTYPHPAISKRTEEFYANKDGLLLVVIEDNGEGAKGKEKSEIDKMYYYNNNKLIKELNKEEKSEYTIKESDGEELLSEFNEYLDIFKATKK
jgi:hypothetical protein